jgi:hypothetical protein
LHLIRGTLPGAILYVALAVNYTSLRLEMAFLPALAVGLALLVETLRAQHTGRRREQISAHTQRHTRHELDIEKSGMAR